jgi:GNAT superfamily N-acetyltransferase
MNAIPGLRRATDADVASITALVCEAYAKWVPLIGREPKPMRADYAVAVRDHIVWILEDQGVVSAVLELIPHADHLLIENVAVAPTLQGQGVGKRLMGFAERMARDLNLLEVRLYTNERFASNIALYERFGFTETHREPLGNSAVVFMHKMLEFSKATI